MSDVYGSPEKYDLEIVDVLDDPNACYRFDMLVVWRHMLSGKVYWFTDSGCSCPSPFEDCRAVEDLEELTPERWMEFQKDVEEHCLPRDGNDPLAADKTQLLARVSALVPQRNWYYIYTGE